jgi:TM2 domain-containing membrane protein YozV
MNKKIFLICFLILPMSDAPFPKYIKMKFNECSKNLQHCTILRKTKEILTQCCGCSGHGICNSGTCVCDVGYTTDPTQVNGCWGYCGYKQKEYVTIICLQVFLGWIGVADFYLEKIVIATCKLLLFLLTLFINPLFICTIKRCCGRQMDDMGIGTKKFYYFPASLLGFLVLIVWSIDCFLYGFGYYHVDGNSIAIYFNN